MKMTFISALPALLAVIALPAQNPDKASADRVAPETSSDRELNTRAYIELLRGDVRKAKSQVMGRIMALDAEQSAKFWPIYQSYESELSGIGNEIVALVHNYTINYENMTDTVADSLAVKLLDIEQKRNELKKKYYLRLKQDLDAITAARFLQVENQLQRLIDLQIAAELPVIREK